MNVIQHVQRVARAVKEAAQGKGFHLRSPQWPALEKKHLAEQPNCQWCWGTVKLQVHHKMPFHLDQSLELDPTNLITLCELKECHCHLEKGHDGNFKNYNPSIEQECREHRKEFHIGDCGGPMKEAICVSKSASTSSSRPKRRNKP